MKNLSILFLMLVIPVQSLSEDTSFNSRENSANKDKAATTTKQPSTPNKTKKSNTTSSKSFVPSEKISADVAVSFPADI